MHTARTKMGATPSLVIPKWQIDPGVDAQHRFSNPAVRTALKTKLMDDSYAASITESGEVNEALQTALLGIIGNRNMECKSEEDDTTDATLDDEPTLTKRRIAIECLVGFICRLRNPKIHNFFIVTLSILALGSNVSVQFWSILCMMGLVFSRVWTIQLVREIGDEVAAMKPHGCSANVGLAVTDNKAYFIKTAHVHAAEVEGVTVGPRVANGHFLYTVNNIQVPLLIPEIYVERGMISLSSLTSLTSCWFR